MYICVIVNDLWIMYIYIYMLDRTQDELALEQEQLYGRSVLSPDVLLLDPVLINGVPIRWIDAKNYYGAHIVNKRLIAKQVLSIYLSIYLSINLYTNI